MIEFKTRLVGHYMNLEIIVDRTKIDLGLQDQMEISGLIDALEEAIEDFKRYKNEKDLS